jgi:hypothetical protein
MLAPAQWASTEPILPFPTAVRIAWLLAIGAAALTVPALAAEPLPPSPWGGSTTTAGGTPTPFYCPAVATTMLFLGKACAAPVSVSTPVSQPPPSPSPPTGPQWNYWKVAMTFNEPLPPQMQAWAQGGSSFANYVNLVERHGANDPSSPDCRDETLFNAAPVSLTGSVLTFTYRTAAGNQGQAAQEENMKCQAS